MTSTTDRLLRLPEVIHRVGLSRTTIYSLIATGEFPRPIVIGTRAVAWSQQELEAWITSKRQAACREYRRFSKQGDGIDPNPAGYTVKNTVIRSGCNGLSADLPGRPQSADRPRCSGFRISADPFGSCENGEGVLLTEAQKPCCNCFCGGG